MSPRRLGLGPRYLWIPLTGLTLVGWASTIFSYDPLLSVYHAIRFIVLFWFYAFIVNEIHLVGWVLIPAGVQIVIQSAVALAQFISQRSIGLQSIGEYYLDPAQSGVSIVSVSGVRLLRAYGLTDHPNILGGCLAFGLLLILSAYLRASTGWTILVALIVLLPVGAGLLVTFSRSAGLAFIVGASVCLIAELMDRRQKSVRRMLWLGLAWLVVLSPLLLGYPRYFGTRLNAGNSFNTPTVEQQSIGERVLLIKAYSAILMHHPWLGVGLGAAPLALRAYRPDFRTGFVPPHMSLLDAAVESGLLGGFFYLTLACAPFVIYLTRRGTLQSGPWATTGIALLLAIAVVGFFDYYTWMFLAGRLWQWLAWGFWAVVSTSGFSHPAKRSAIGIAQTCFHNLVLSDYLKWPSNYSHKVLQLI